MPDRPIIDVFNTSGVLVARLGDITGMPWGGGSYTLPSGTYGLWTLRDGTWMKGQVTMFYAHAKNLTLLQNETFSFNANERYEFSIDETFPFGTINVPLGRIVTWETFLHFVEIKIFTATGGGGTATTLSTPRLFSISLRASLNGGAAADYNYLSGPTTSGENAYTSVKLRLKWHGTKVGGGTVGVASWSVRRNMSIRLFGHEVNADPTLSSPTASVLVTTTTEGRGPELDSDQGGGSGTDAGGYQGDAPAKPLV